MTEICESYLLVMLCSTETAPIPSHAVLANRVERLYLSGDIMVLVATATLAWGVNLPARLVIVKGTEYYDGKKSRYVDYPLTDVLQMIGRAGRPGFDTEGRAVVLVESSKKNFYKVRCILFRTNRVKCNWCSHIFCNTCACYCFSY
jgi:activating signal cointegrator complex subunit 3